MLTCTQMMRLSTRQPNPPWSIGALRGIFSVEPNASFSVRSVISLIEDMKIVLFMSVREVSVVIREVANVEELISKWNSFPGLSKDMLVHLADILRAQGILIKFVSNDRRVVGITCSNSSLVQIPALHVDDRVLDGIKDVAAGAIGVAGGVGLFGVGVQIAAGGAALPPPADAGALWLGGSLIAAGFVSAAAGGAYVGVGLGELGVGGTPVTPVGNQSAVDGQGNVISGPEGEQIGETPPGVDAGNLANVPNVDVNDLPEAPPEGPTEGPTEEPPNF
jgi:hypothetical protein